MEINDDIKTKNLTKAIAWCIENTTKLQKNGYFIEWKLRKQELIDIIKVNYDNKYKLVQD